VEAGREPLEYSPRLAAAWERPDGVEMTLFYDLLALFDVRLEGDLSEAASTFRHDIARTEP
jgi:hypothetical protein